MSGETSSPLVIVGIAGVVLRDNQILMVRRKYGRYRQMWCIPCGHVEPGEDVRQAVKREIKEETGLDVEIGDVVDVLSTHHPGGKSVVGVYFLATEKGGILVAGDDASEAEFFPLDQPPTEMAFQADKVIMDRLIDRRQCAVERRRFSAGAIPARQLLLQPVATGAVMEETKSSKPLV